MFSLTFAATLFLLVKVVSSVPINCTCVLQEQCKKPYGEHPLDIYHLGTHSPCENYGEVKCCSRKGFEEFYQKYDEDSGRYTTPKHNINIQQNKNASTDTQRGKVKCHCLPKGICQRNFTSYDPNCNGVFERCCIPDGEIISPFDFTQVQDSSPVDDPNPEPVFHRPGMAVESDPPGDENAGPVKCVQASKCFHVYGSDVSDILHHGVLAPCKRVGELRCIKVLDNLSHATSPPRRHSRRKKGCKLLIDGGEADSLSNEGESKDNSFQNSPDIDEILRELERQGIKNLPARIYVENDTLFLDGGSQLIFVHPQDGVEKPAESFHPRLRVIIPDNRDMNGNSQEERRNESPMCEEDEDDEDEVITTKIPAAPRVIFPGPDEEEVTTTTTTTTPSTQMSTQPLTTSDATESSTAKALETPTDSDQVLSSMMSSIKSLTKFLLNGDNTRVVLLQGENGSRNFTISREEVVTLIDILSRIR